MMITLKYLLICLLKYLLVKEIRIPRRIVVLSIALIDIVDSCLHQLTVVRRLVHV